MLLLKVVAKKEKVHWKRIVLMKEKIGWIGFIILTILISIWHYMVALMHFLFECFLFVVYRSQFDTNMTKMLS